MISFFGRASLPEKKILPGNSRWFVTWNVTGPPSTLPVKKNIPAKSSIIFHRTLNRKKVAILFPIKYWLFLHEIKDVFVGIFFFTGKVLGGPVTFQVKNHFELPGKIS